MGLPGHNADTDKDLNEREEFNSEEAAEMARQNPTFGAGEIVPNPAQFESNQKGNQQQQEYDEDDDFWYGSGDGSQNIGQR